MRLRRLSDGDSGLSWSSVPASPSASGTAGQIAYDGSHFYLATAANTWRRAELSTWVPTDPYFSSVSLLLHFDGNLTDSSGNAKTVTAYGSAAASGTAKYGANSLSLNGTSQYLRASASADYALPGDFAIEAWLSFTSASSGVSGAYAALVAATYPVGGANPGWQFRINGTSSAFDTINLYTGLNDLNWSATFNLNTWHHVAVARSSGTVRAYVDGAQVGSSVSNSDDMTPSTNADVWIGRLDLSGYEFYFPGRIDELRITKGTARGYTGSTIPVPGEAFPNS
jgi:hypothetical protein